MITIAGKEIGDGAAPYIVAEIACAHEGDPDRARALIDCAAAAGADAVQLQVFFVRNLISPRSPHFEAATSLEIPEDAWPGLIEHARGTGLHVWANVFDNQTLGIALAGGVRALKLHSSDLENPILLEAVAGAGQPLSLAAGGATLDEIGRSVDFLRGHGADDIILMHGFQAFPTKPEDAHLRFIGALRERFGCLVGYQDHTDGATPLAFTLPLAAVGFGACVLEKHITDDRSRRGTDYEAALGPADFKRFVEMARALYDAIGDGEERRLSEAERGYRERMKKHIVAARDIAAGETIVPDMLAFLRGVDGLSPWQVSTLVGRVARNRIEAFEGVREANLEDGQDDVKGIHAGTGE